MDIPREETCFIVVPADGMRAFPRGREGLEDADHYAASKARSTEEPYAILVVPRNFMDSARIARFRGVVFDILKESDIRDEN